MKALLTIQTNNTGNGANDVRMKDAIENTQVEASNDKEKEVMVALRDYNSGLELMRKGFRILEQEQMAEANKEIPDDGCSTALKSMLQNRIWTGEPASCKPKTDTTTESK